ncbi:MAG TPA: hypothetical protein VGP89_10165 [Candidatus Angelobacter sp.]|jgi:hypothetical protein|nr:hypothetical protein [Candidatus Angelobacter sp.]
MKKYFTIFALGMMTLSTAAFAGTTATNTNTVSPTLQISATIQSAVQLTLSTGTAAVSHCAVTAGGTTDYAMSFGTVDALGINNGSCNKFAPVTPGTTNAIYWSDYNMTPVYTSQTATANPTITAKVTTDFAAPHNIFVVRDSANSSTAPGSAAAFTAVSTGTPDTIVSGAASGTAQTRFIGVAVTPASGATVLTGPQTATVTFTLTVQ